ncbi:MAG: hypothetical protein PF501_02305 [Salinisphaera sp.]|jgi:hypothetical protein|nr:hypothetical protein [Salinisphaera sp.]
MYSKFHQTGVFFRTASVAAILSLAGTGYVYAHTDNAMTGSHDDSAASQSSHSGMPSRMAPTQQTKGTGAMPNTDSSNQMSSHSGHSASSETSRSIQPSMAPTQNTKGDGGMSDANSGK